MRDKKYQHLINQINLFEEHLKILSDSELKLKNLNLRKQYKLNPNLNSYIIESFALTREASLRTVGLRHFDVQLLGGLTLNDQKIAEMRTGEGKTLVATLPAALNTLTNKGVHIITVNEYLANRDQIAMSKIYRFLGLSTGLVLSEMKFNEKKENYEADITYTTNYEIVFDYLRDNMAVDLSDIVLRPFNYCIIDEVDSILIDEAKTPLIISLNEDVSTDRYILANEIASYLIPGIDFIIDEKNSTINLLERGNSLVRELVASADLYDQTDPWISYILNALKAAFLYRENKNYIIDKKRIIIIDEFTGRMMPDRRWGDGLHQAIEAKESLPIRKNNKTLAEVTYQSFFLMYPKLSGMTGTAKTSEVEFENIYSLSVNQVPTARPNKRKDLVDLIYRDQFSKWNAIAQTCQKINLTEQPILIGTKTIEASELLAQLLNEYKLSYQLLNAKPENVKRESEIVAQAGELSSITIATNMAGRGTDIVLGGNNNFKVQKRLYEILINLKKSLILENEYFYINSIFNSFQDGSQKLTSILISLLNDNNFLNLSDIEKLRILKENDIIFTPLFSYQCSIRSLNLILRNQYKKSQQQQNKIIQNLGGLYVLGTERNDSRRIDNQLRGRCGRQGDPGISQFLISLDDDLLRLFGSSKDQDFIKRQMGDQPVDTTFIASSLDSVQTKIEEKGYQERQSLFDYDQVLNYQRLLIYEERKRLLTSDTFTDFLVLNESFYIELNSELNSEEFDSNKIKNFMFENKNTDSFLKIIGIIFGFPYLEFNTYYKRKSSNLQLNDFFFLITNEIWLLFKLQEFLIDLYGSNYRGLIKEEITELLDQAWEQHLLYLELLRDSVRWRAYGQKNPLSEYKGDALTQFASSLTLLKVALIFKLFRIYIC